MQHEFRVLLKFPPQDHSIQTMYYKTVKISLKDILDFIMAIGKQKNENKVSHYSSYMQQLFLCLSSYFKARKFRGMKLL